MTSAPDRGPDVLHERVLILAHVGRDAELAREVLDHHGIGGVRCASGAALVAELTRGCGAVLIAEEALTPSATDALADALAGQPAWSDVPVIMIASREASTITTQETLRHVERLGHVTLLDRPTRLLSLVSAVRVALRARRRQYEARDLLLRLEDGVAQRDRFLAMLGHELRNPLQAIIHSVDLLTGAESRARSLIDRQARHLSRLVDELLDVSRVTSGKVVLRRATVDLRALVERTVAGLRPGLGDVALEMSLGDRPLLVDVDAMRVEQVISNVLTNAIKYTPSGSITVSLTPDTTGPSGWVKTRIEDTGLGIPPEMLPRIFDLFTQVDGSLERARGGLGIGLTIVRSLVELHGGDVSVTSEGPGRGTCVEIRLPASTAEAATRASDPSVSRRSSTTGRPPRRVLIVEDDEDIRALLKDLLEMYGFQVEAASDGVDAVELAKTTSPEVALVDVGLPGMSGYDVARAIRRDLGKEIYLAALTGYGQPEDKGRALAAGFDIHITKPVDIHQLTRLLDGAR